MGAGLQRGWGSPHILPAPALAFCCFFHTTMKRRGVLLFRKGKLGCSHVDVVRAAGKQTAVLRGCGWGSGHHQRKAFVFTWVRLVNVSISPFPSSWFFNHSFAPLRAFKPNKGTAEHLYSQSPPSSASLGKLICGPPALFLWRYKQLQSPGWEMHCSELPSYEDLSSRYLRMRSLFILASLNANTE